MFYGEALETMFWARQDALKDLRSSDLKYRMGAQSLLGMLYRALPFYWDADTARIVLNAASNYPKHIPFSRDLLYCDYGWFYFPTPLFAFTDEQVGLEDKVKAIAWAYGDISIQPFEELDLSTRPPTKPGLSFFIFTDHSPHPLPTLSMCLHDGEDISTYLVESSGGSLASHCALKFILAAGAWLRQRILTAHEEQPERHARKRLAREIGNVSLPNIHVVQLRRTESSHHNSAAVSERDWHCQWMVRGHWRNQYYASSGDHMPKYIHPYIKGPEDKPLKPPSGEIFAVTR